MFKNWIKVFKAYFLKKHLNESSKNSDQQITWTSQYCKYTKFMRIYNKNKIKDYEIDFEHLSNYFKNEELTDLASY